MEITHHALGMGHHGRRLLASLVAISSPVLPLLDTELTPRPTAPEPTATGALCCGPPSTGAVVAGERSDTMTDDGPGVPDRVSSDTGGIAALLRDGTGSPLPGHVFLLMATAGSNAPARLFDSTPFAHDNPMAQETIESNDVARALVEDLSGTDIATIAFTSAPGGGPSGGLAYAIAYLNVVTDGAFTGTVRVAATGEMSERGYVDPIEAIDEKAAAAAFAEVDVLFTASVPGDATIAEHASRDVGEQFRPRHTGLPLLEERQLVRYRTWGSSAPDGMDVVLVHHLADVAAYLCGTGSGAACDIAALFDGVTTAATPETSLRPDAADVGGLLRR